MSKKLGLQSADLASDTTQNLLKENETLKQEIKQLKSRKRYGLVWESKPEEVIELCKEKLPVLIEDTEREIKTDNKKPVNILIEGDNYHALSVLNYTHEGKVDVIYIDPPYNTGAKDWKYNNNFVDSNDSYRHSKWLSMMGSRLQSAKRLLKEDGVLICAVDGHAPQHDVTSIVQGNADTRRGATVGPAFIGNRAARAVAACRGIASVAVDDQPARCPRVVKDNPRHCAAAG